MSEEPSILKEFRVTLETVTPMFLGGAEPRAKLPELRPPSYRGAMRYWLRAVAGGITGDNLSALRSLETSVFGSSAEKNGRSSPISIRHEKENLKSSSYSTLSSKHNGVGYLWFSARKTENEKERSGLSGSFDLRFSVRQMGIEGTSSMLRAFGTLWLLTRLGGIGSRVHRGAGNIQVKEVNLLPDELAKYTKKLPLQVQATTPEYLAEEIQSGINYIRKFFSRDVQPGKVSPEMQFDILHPDLCQILVVNREFDEWEKALDAIGRTFKEFRFERNPDYSTIKSVVHTSKNLSQPIQRAAFGLPIPLSDKMILQSASYDRRSSPLWFHITKLAGEPSKYTIVIVWFKSKFFPDMVPKSHAPEKLKLIEKNKTEHIGDVPNQSLISTFLHGPDAKKGSLAEKGWDLLEVSL